jgi:N-acetylmuramoyl-L-alanine amidase
MKITNNKLVTDAGETPVIIKNSPNQGSTIVPKYLVIHYTAGRSAKSSVDWFMNPAANASAHLVIGLDGSVTQVVPFNKKAFHAGVSRWNGLSGLNSHSIGIELDNPGLLRKTGNNWISWFGQQYPDSVVIQATHKHQEMPAGWHMFTELQIEACVNIGQLLINHYQLLDVVGHEDIAPFRKVDPGPAFPMEAYKSKVLGRQDDVADIFKVNTDDTNFRAGPGTQHSILGKLKKGNKVEFIKSNLGWYQVFLVTRVDGINEPEGWIHSSLLTKA